MLCFPLRKKELLLQFKKVGKDEEYEEILFIHPAAEYGAPNFYAIRFKDKKQAILVHLGRNPLEDQEKVVGKGSLGALMYSLQNLGYYPLVQLKIKRSRYRHPDFEFTVFEIEKLGTFVCIDEKDKEAAKVAFRVDDKDFLPAPPDRVALLSMLQASLTSLTE